MNKPIISKSEIQILEALDEVGGFIVRDVAKHVDFFGVNNHQHSGAVRAWLCDLEKLGFVRRMNELKPVCWCRTQKGTAILQQLQSP